MLGAVDGAQPVGVRGGPLAQADAPQVRIERVALEGLGPFAQIAAPASDAPMLPPRAAVRLPRRPIRRTMARGTGMRLAVRQWLVMGIAALAVAAAACGSDDPAAPTETATASPTATATAVPATETAVPTATAAASPSSDASAGAPRTVEDLYVAVGNPDADAVLVNTQGGPVPFLFSREEIPEAFGLLDLDRVYLASVHQSQTIDPAPFTDADITFEEAQAADAASVAMLAAVVDHFLARGKTVYVVGISFGAFMVQELLATQGNVAEGYLVMVGRIDMPEAVWTEFAEGRTVGFADGVDVIEVTSGEAGMGGEGPVADRNMARLAAGLGHHRYSERLAAIDMANVVYVSGDLDEQVGRLSDAEAAFLTGRGADVIRYDGGHDTPFAVARDAFSRVLPADLFGEPPPER